MRDLLRTQIRWESIDNKSFRLKDLLKTEQLPIIVNITSSFNINKRSIRSIFTRDTPLLLIQQEKIDSILAQCHQTKYRRRTQAKLIVATKFRTIKNLSRSTNSLVMTNGNNINNDLKEENLRQSLLKLINENSRHQTLCRIPLIYDGLFEILNENGLAIEPCKYVSELQLTNNIDGDNDKNWEKWPSRVLLRKNCTVYLTANLDEKETIISDNRKDRQLSSSDSCYGSSSSDLIDSHKIITLLNRSEQLQAGEIISIVNVCYGRLLDNNRKKCDTNDYSIDNESKNPMNTSSNSFSSSWLRNITKPRLLFSKKFRKSILADDTLVSTKHNIVEQLSTVSHERYLKCKTENDQIVYISFSENGLFSPIRTLESNELDDITGVFNLKDLIRNFRFPLSVQSVKNTEIIDFFSMENRQSNELSNKLRLLTTYSEHVVWVCPLTTNNLMAKNKLIIPLPLISDIYFHRCINMKDILKSKYYQEFFIDCFQTIKQYENRISKIDFPLDIESPSLLNNHPRYKKRSQSEFYYEPIVISNSLEKSNNHYSYSSENINNNISNNRLFYCASSSSSSSSLSVHNYSNEKIKMNDSLQYRDSFEKIKEKLSNSMNYHEQNSQTNNRSYYSRIKLDNSINSLKYRSRKKSIPQIDDNFKRSPFIQHKIIEDTNYNDIDQLYDYIRTGIMSNNILQIMNLSTENLSNNNNEQYYDANESYKTDNSEYSINKIKIDNVMYISQSPKKMRINNDLKQNSPILISKKQHQKSKVNSTTLDVEHEILVNKNKTKSRRFSKYNGNQSLNSITNNIVEKTKKQNYNNVSLENIDFQSCTEYKIDDDSNKVKKYKKQQHEQQQQQPSIRQHPQTEALVTYTTSARKNKIEPKVINLIDENDRNMSAKSSNSKKIYYRV